MVSDVEFILVVSMPDYAPRCYGLVEDHVKIGRGRNNHLPLDNAAISSSHCELVRDVETGEWNFRDLGSTNGSKTNGHRVNSDSVIVRDGDQILLGEEIRILFCEVREIEDPAAVEEEELDVNPVAAAVARQTREDKDGGQTMRLGDNEK